MKKRYLFVTGLTFSLALGTALCLTGCGEHEHTLDRVEKKDATCTEAGYEAYYKCTGCDLLFSDEKAETEIAAPKAIAAGHRIEAVAKKDATCTEAGYEAHYKCTVCNTLYSDEAGTTVIEAATVIPAGHKIEAVAKKEATCTEAGYEAHYKCTVCNTLYSDEAGTTVIEAATVIPAAHKIEAVAKKDATCTEAGYEAHYKCTVCNTLFSDEAGTTVIEAATVIPAGHKIEAVDKKDATCTEAGYEAHYKCTVCNKLFSDAEGKTAIEAATVIPAKGHTIVDVPEKRPTCTEDGAEEHYKCSVCNTLFEDEEGKKVIDKAPVIPAEHRLAKQDGKEATCKDEGYEEYYKCSLCNKMFSDAAGKNEISAPVVINKTDTHTKGFNYTSENVPAPVAEGGTLTSACTVCGEEMGEVTYKAGLEMTAGGIKNAVYLDQDAGVYYYKQHEAEKSNAFIGFQAQKAGTYTITLTDVFSDDNVVHSLHSLSVVTDKYPTLVSKGRMLNAHKWKENDEAAAKWKAQTNIEGFVEGERTDLTTVTITVTADDLAATGSVYFMLLILNWDVGGDSPTGVMPEHSSAFLMDFKITEA